MATDAPPEFGIDRDDRSYRYYRAEVERHWDPGAIDLNADREALADANEALLDGLRGALAKFGAGEQAVTADLAPLAVVLDTIEDQSFIATQLYEEAKHTDFFDRYWREVINPVEEAHGLDRTSPTDSRWFDSDYRRLFERQERYMRRLLTDDTPENRARAYSVYHLVVEGIFAQTGYYGLQSIYGEESDRTPTLSGLVEGLFLIRGDEGRHVGFGVAKLRELVHEEGVDPALLSETVGELVGFVQGSLAAGQSDVEGTDDLFDRLDIDLVEYAIEKHTERMAQITAADTDLPTAADFTDLE